MKMLKFGTKNALFGYFLARILKNYCHIWNQILYLKFFISGFLTRTANFGISSDFSKVLGSAFFEGPGLGMSSLYKVCRFFIYFKGYLRCKTITSQNVSSEAQIKNFFILWKSYVPFSSYPGFCVFNHPMI